MQVLVIQGHDFELHCLSSVDDVVRLAVKLSARVEKVIDQPVLQAAHERVAGFVGEARRKHGNNVEGVKFLVERLNDVLLDDVSLPLAKAGLPALTVIADRRRHWKDEHLALVKAMSGLAVDRRVRC